jgi:hypothetical protein
MGGLVIVDNYGHSFTGGAEGEFGFYLVFVSAILVVDPHLFEVF